MIHNPPFVVILLRSYQSAARVSRTHPELFEARPLDVILAALLKRTFGHQPYNFFLVTYQFYLQSIPLEIARSAWGINAAEAAALTHQTKP
ncbi:MAG: hypothetical protein ABIS50_11420 [Luteolibacter sp.]|uniref:hypothetical protein n=1 Tax=Luteolibacter sp. TaxID=1962973 RepID=UPI003264D9AD